MSEQSQAPPSSPAAPSQGKESYEKPAVAWVEPLEVRPNLMAACGKINFTQPGCGAVEGS